MENSKSKEICSKSTTSIISIQQQLMKHFGSSLNNGVYNMMAKEIKEINFPSAQTMVDNWHQSGAKSWSQWIYNSPLNDIYQNHKETFHKLQNYQLQFTENIYSPLSQYISSTHHVFKGTANGLIKRVFAVYNHLKLGKIAPNCCMQIDMRFRYDIIPHYLIEEEELEWNVDDDDTKTMYKADKNNDVIIDYDSKNASNPTEHTIHNHSKTETVDLISNETIDQIIRQCPMPLDDDSYCYKRYELLLYGTEIKLVEAVLNNNIPECAFENAPLCMIFNSTASVGQILNKLYSETTGLITVSFHVYHGTISVYFYVADGNEQLFGSRIFGDDLISIIPLLFEDRSVDKSIMDEINKCLQFKPDSVYQQYYLSLMQHAVNEYENDIEQKTWINEVVVGEILNEWNDGENKQIRQINTIKRCFIEYGINYHYFQTHTRKEFMQLLKTYDIKTGIAIKIWGRALFDFKKSIEQQSKSQQDCIKRLNDSLLAETSANGCTFSNKTQPMQQHFGHWIQVLCCGYSHECFDGDYQDLIKLIIFYFGIVEQHLDDIAWSNLTLIQSPSINNDQIMDESVTITPTVMREYCLVALERLNYHDTENNTDLIPINIRKKHDNYYDIEWVLIVNIIHLQCNVGLSFRYNKLNVFEPTAIYLDTAEIERKHKLIGLKADYCKHLTPFNLNHFQFSDHDDYENDEADDNNNLL